MLRQFLLPQRNAPELMAASSVLQATWQVAPLHFMTSVLKQNVFIIKLAASIVEGVKQRSGVCLSVRPSVSSFSGFNVVMLN